MSSNPDEIHRPYQGATFINEVEDVIRAAADPLHERVSMLEDNMEKMLEIDKRNVQSIQRLTFAIWLLLVLIVGIALGAVL